MANCSRSGKRDLRDAISLLQQYGATDIEHQRGKHIKLRAVYHGKRITTVLSVTPSDWRTHLNAISRLKRQLRNVDAGGARSSN
jgi:hypothetical protein